MDYNWNTNCISNNTKMKITKQQTKEIKKVANQQIGKAIGILRSPKEMVEFGIDITINMINKIIADKQRKEKSNG